MSRDILWARHAQRDLRRPPGATAARIVRAVTLLAGTERGDLREREGSAKAWALHVGDRRVRFVYNRERDPYRRWPSVMFAVPPFCFMAFALIALHLPLDGRRWLAMAVLAACAALAVATALQAASDGRRWLNGAPAGRYQASLDQAYLFALAVPAALAAPRIGQRPSVHRWLWPALAASVAAPVCYALAAPLGSAVRTDYWWQQDVVLVIADVLTALAALYWCLWLATREPPVSGGLLAIALLASGAAFVGVPVQRGDGLVLVAVGFWRAGIVAEGRRRLRPAR